MKKLMIYILFFSMLGALHAADPSQAPSTPPYNAPDGRTIEQPVDPPRLSPYRTDLYRILDMPEGQHREALTHLYNQVQEAINQLPTADSDRVVFLDFIARSIQPRLNSVDHENEVTSSLAAGPSDHSRVRSRSEAGVSEEFTRRLRPRMINFIRHNGVGLGPSGQASSSQPHSTSRISTSDPLPNSLTEYLEERRRRFDGRDAE